MQDDDVQKQLEPIEKKIAALKLVQSEIQKNDSFTYDEKANLTDELERLQTYKDRLSAEIELRKKIFDDEISKLQQQLKQREAAINGLFSRPELAEYTDIMRFFAQTQRELQERLAAATEYIATSAMPDVTVPEEEASPDEQCAFNGRLPF